MTTQLRGSGRGVGFHRSRAVAGEIRKSSNGRGGRGNEQRLRAATIAEEGATITVADRGIAIIAVESTVSEKGNDAAGDGGR
ncbi:hypothetical protein B296_00029833 [Ensete ventricosum]|uniref:Uncharacterized protein n=1 Tax=Ensete ventricosum TaxID=4639 RepID=A0A426X9D7_ENSVE|nr:hypothetical protein B296_00029833 [Ensete ventricosum]